MIKNNLKIVVYSTPTCNYCHLVKDYLDEKKIKYQDIDVSLDQKKAREIIDKSGQMGVPVVIITKDGKEKVVVGFDKEKINEILGIK